MKRKIIKIDQDECIGCGLCAQACHEGAIGLADGKAVLLREDYCDGLGDCLPACPTEAITFEEREAPAYDRAAVSAARAQAGGEAESADRLVPGIASAAQAGGEVKKEAALPCGCPGSQTRKLERKPHEASRPEWQEEQAGIGCQGELSQWPIQIKLVPVNAPYFEGADLLIAADCTAFAYGDFHRRFIRNRITLIGCPKLDEGDYADKLTQILRNNEIRSVVVVRMEVPCCSGLENAVKRAMQESGKWIPWRVVIVSAEGEILSE